MTWERPREPILLERWPWPPAAPVPRIPGRCGGRPRTDLSRRPAQWAGSKSRAALGKGAESQGGRRAAPGLWSARGPAGEAGAAGP